MKQMEYGKDVLREVLYHGVIDGVECAIVNTRGSHPCAYINVPKSILDKYDNPELDYDKWFADCHGGFTYADTEAPGIDERGSGSVGTMRTAMTIHVLWLTERLCSRQEITRNNGPRRKSWRMLLIRFILLNMIRNNSV